MKNNLPSFNDDPNWPVPMPAPYAIGRNGTSPYADVNPDYMRMPEPEDMILAPRRAAKVAAYLTAPQGMNGRWSI